MALQGLCHLAAFGDIDTHCYPLRFFSLRDAGHISVFYYSHNGAHPEIPAFLNAAPSAVTNQDYEGLFEPVPGVVLYAFQFSRQALDDHDSEKIRFGPNEVSFAWLRRLRSQSGSAPWSPTENGLETAWFSHSKNKEPGRYRMLASIGRPDRDGRIPVHNYGDAKPAFLARESEIGESFGLSLVDWDQVGDSCKVLFSASSLK